MSSFFERSSFLEKLTIRCDAAAESDDFSRGLAKALSKFNSLKLFESQMNPRMARKVLGALAGHTELESLHLRSDVSLDNKAFSALSVLLRRRNSKLYDLGLDLRYDDANYMFGDPTFAGAMGMVRDDGMVAVSSGLGGKNALKSLRMCGNKNVSSSGWRAFSTLLGSSRSMLQSLHMPLNSIGNDGMTHIANALAKNKVLRRIDLSATRNVTSSGWRAFCAVFQSTESALEVMGLWDNNIGSDVHVAWASSLASNQSMKELGMHFFPSMTPVGMAAFTRILCNKSTIMTTFLSNHALGKVITGHTNTVNTPELDLLLENNRVHTAFGAARQKIIMYHFSDADSLQLFKEMDLGILPNALAWMSRVVEPGSNESGNGVGEDMKFDAGSVLLYKLLRDMPELFENNTEGVIAELVLVTHMGFLQRIDLFFCCSCWTKLCTRRNKLRSVCNDFRSCC